MAMLWEQAIYVNILFLFIYYLLILSSNALKDSMSYNFFLIMFFAKSLVNTKKCTNV